MFGIGNTIGAGAFALTGVAAQYAGKSAHMLILCRTLSNLEFLAERAHLWDDSSCLC